MKHIFAYLFVTAILAVLVGCGNSDGTVTLNKSQTAELVKLLGTYEGPAHSERIMGAMMTGTWTATFFQDESGVPKCKCTLRLHDEENGWGNPSTVNSDVKVYQKSGDSEYSLRTIGQFSDSEPQWSISIDGMSLSSGRTINTITLFDMSSYEITLQRK
jgi:hypothetical protein